MVEKIEEIKQGLQACSEQPICNLVTVQCPYSKYSSEKCVRKLCKDALVLIEELQKKLKDEDKNNGNNSISG